MVKQKKKPSSPEYCVILAGKCDRIIATYKQHSHYITLCFNQAN